MSNYDKTIGYLKDIEDKDKYKSIRNNLARIEKSGMSYDNQFMHYEDRRIDAPIMDSKYINAWDNPEDEGYYEKAAQRQPWAAKAGAGVGRVATKAATEIAKIPGVALGIGMGIVGQIEDAASGRDNTDFMSVAFDNAWVRSMNDLNEVINKEVLPVYVRKAVEEGNLWENIKSIDFWATDGADGLGYIAAMLAPGALLSRAGLGARLINATGKGGKALGLSTKADKGVKLAGRMSELGLPTTARNIDLYAQTIANTVLEAGAEAQQAGEEYENDLLAKLQSEEISQEEFDTRIKLKSNIMGNVFGANAAILIGPNAIMSKMLWGGARNSGKMAKRVSVGAGGVEKVAKQSIKQQVGNWGRAYATGAFSEGVWEEGMQEAAGNYFGDNPDAGFFSSIGEIPNAYMESLKTVDGQKAIFLGAVFGGTMHAFSNARQTKKERESFNTLIDYANEGITGYFDIFKGDTYKRDENGSPIVIDGVKQFDEQVLFEKLGQMEGLEKLSALYDLAVANGYTEEIRQIRDQTVARLIAPFLLNEDLGLETLREYLNNSPGVLELADNEGVNPSEIIEDIMQKAELLERSNRNFEDFSQPLINVEHNEAVEKDYKDFNEHLRNVYLNIKSNGQFIDNNLNKINEQLQDILKEKGIEFSEFVNDKESRINLENSDTRIKNLSQKRNEYIEQLDKIKQAEETFWSESSNQVRFNDFMKKNKKLAVEQAEESETGEIGDIMQEIQDAETEADLDKISKTNTSADPMINNAIVDKRKELSDKLEAEKAAKIEEQKKESEETRLKNEQNKLKKDSLGNWIDDSFAKGEPFPLTKSDLIPFSKEAEKSDVTDFTGNIVSSTDTHITISIDELGGQKITLPLKSTKDIENDPDVDFSTEGSENAEVLIPKDNENNQETTDNSFAGGSKLVSFDRIKNKVFDWITEQFPFLQEYEKTPVDKRGVVVKFEINKKDFGNSAAGQRWNNALKGIERLEKGETLTKKEIDFLIDHLPINSVIGESIKAPMETLPNGQQRVKTFEGSSKILRTAIVNALIQGHKLSDLSTTIEGQHSGKLKVAPKTKENKVAENSIYELHHFKGLSNKQKLAYVKSNLLVVNSMGNFIRMDGSNDETFINKDGRINSQASGEVYLMIPMANGNRFPLKLNIQKINENDSDTLARIYEHMLNNVDVKANTRINRLKDDELKKHIFSEYADVIKIIGKSKNDITIDDITSFFIYNRTTNMKTRVILEEDAGGNSLVFGNNRVTKENFKADDFKAWLRSEEKASGKRYNISIKPKQNQTTKATLRTSDAYIDYLINSKMLNTNAVVNEPTFQGFTELFLNSGNLMLKGKPLQPKKVETKKVEPTITPVTPVTSTVAMPKIPKNPTTRYSGKLNPDGTIKLGARIEEQETMFKIEFDAMQLNGTLEISLNSDYAKRAAVNSPDDMLYRAFNNNNANTEFVDEVITVRKAVIKKRADGKWEVVEKGLLHYGKKGEKVTVATPTVTPTVKPTVVTSLKQAVPVVIPKQAPYNEAKDGKSLFSTIVDGVSYYASKATGKVYGSKNLKTKKGQATVPLSEDISDPITDDVIIAKVEESIKNDGGLFGDPNLKLKKYSETLENNDESIRNSGKDFVSSHEIDNSAEAAAVANMKKVNTKTDVVEATREDVDTLRRELMKHGLMKMGSAARNNVVKNKTNQSIYDAMVVVAKEFNETSKDIKIQC